MTQSKEGFFWSPTHSYNGLETDAVRTSSHTVAQFYDVVVIGTGFAGLIAARDISQNKDIKVLLVEGRDRIGGRTWTAKAMGQDFEMGGTWVHWSQPHVYSEIRRYGLHEALKITSGTGDLQRMMFKPKGQAVKDMDPQATDALLDQTAEKFFTVNGQTARQLMPFPHQPFRTPAQPWEQYDHMSVRDRLDQIEATEEAKQLLEAHTNSFGCGTAEDTSFTEALRWFALGGYGFQGMYEAVGMFKLGNGGMTALASRILDDYQGDILFNSIVQEIHQDQERVSISFKNRPPIQAKQAVCTIPLNCLSDITFSPPLDPTRLQAISKGHTNTGAKIHFSLPTTEKGWFVNTPDATQSDYLMSFSDTNPSVKGQAQGTNCIAFSYSGKLQDPRTNEAIISSFKALRPDAEVQAYLTHPWATDEFAKGTWYCGGPGVTTRYLKALQKRHGRVAMASGDWADGWRGFVDGAVEQGMLAARWVVRSQSV